METTSDHLRPSLRSGALLLLSVALAGCRPKADPPAEPAVVEAGPPPGVSLLQLTPSRLALEWQFEAQTWSDSMGSYKPANPFTGWKGKWLAVRVPKDAHVSAITLSVANPMRVSVWRDDVKMKEVSLRERAVIPIDAAGGDYRLEVIGEPEKINDLDVLGQPGAERVSVAKLPGVRSASLDAGENISGPWPDRQSYCEKMGGDRCGSSSGGSIVGTAPPMTSVGFTDGPDGTWLAISTKRGWFAIRDARRVEKKSVRVERPEAGTPFLRFEHVDRSDDVPGARLDGEIGKIYVVAERWLVVCRVVNDWPDCDDRHVVGKWSGSIPDAFAVVDAGPPPPFPPPLGKWNPP